MIGRQAGCEPAPLELPGGGRAVNEQDGLPVAHDGVSQRQAITLIGAWPAFAEQIGHHFLHGHVVLFLTATAGSLARCLAYPALITPTHVYLIDHPILLRRYGSVLSVRLARS